VLEVKWCVKLLATLNELHISHFSHKLIGQVLPHSRFHNIESVPPYSVWVEGDNKNYSEDSVNHGPISKKLLVGQAARIIWPPSRWSKLTRMSLSEGKAWWS